MRHRGRLVVWAVLSAAWVAGIGTWTVQRLPERIQAAGADLSAGINVCRDRYAKTDRQGRCIDIMQARHVRDVNQAYATIALASLGPPLIALGLIVAVRMAERGSRR